MKLNLFERTMILMAGPVGFEPTISGYLPLIGAPEGRHLNPC